MKKIGISIIVFILTCMSLPSTIYGAQEVSVTKSTTYNYTTYGLGTKSWPTSIYKVKFKSGSADAFCLEPNQSAPGSGTYTVKRVAVASNVAKAIYYGWAGPKSALWWNQSGNKYSSYKKGARWIIVHMAAAKAYGAKWDYNASSNAKKCVNSFMSWLDKQPSIPSNNDVFFQKAGERIDSTEATVRGPAAYFESHKNYSSYKSLLTSLPTNTQVSKAVSIRNYNANQNIRVTVPSDVRAVITKNETDGNIIKIYNWGEDFTMDGSHSGDWRFNFLRKADSLNETSTISIKGTSVAGTYEAYRLSHKGYPSQQDLGCIVFNSSPSEDELDITWKDNPKYPLYITKSDEYDKPVKGATYQVGKSKNGNTITDIVGTITTNTNGSTSVEVSPGTYYIKETYVPKPFIYDTSIKTVTITNSKKTVTFSDIHQTGSIKVKKRDRLSKKYIKGSVFKITNTSDIYFYDVDEGDFDTDPELLEEISPDDYIDEDELDDLYKDEPTHYSPGEFVYSFYGEDADTNETTIIDKLPLGDYILEEIVAPKGYQLSDEKKSFSIVYDETSAKAQKHASLLEIDYDNTPETMEVTVKKEYKELLTGDTTLKGAQYTLYAGETIKAPYDDDIILYEKDEEISVKNGYGDTGTKTIDKDSMTWNHLPIGTYYVKETKAPRGMLLNKEVLTFQPNDHHKETKISQEDMKKRRIRIYKYETSSKTHDSTKGINNIEFTIKLKSDIDKLGWDKAPVYDHIMTQDYKGKAGYALTKYLPYGTYIMRETKGMNKYYGLQDIEIVIDKDVSEIDEDEDAIISVPISNELIEAYIKLIKKDKKTGERITLNSSTFEIYQGDTKVTCKVGNKTYDTFTTNAKGQVIPSRSFTSVEDELGSVTTPLQLTYGDYEIREILSPKGYQLLKEPVLFSITDKNTKQGKENIIEIDIDNEPIEGKCIIQKTIKDIQADMILDNIHYQDITFGLYAYEDIVRSDNGDILYHKDDLIEEKHCDEKGYIEFNHLPLGHYYLKENHQSATLISNDDIYDVDLTYQDKKEYVVKKTIENTPVGVDISKTDITGDDELEGAHLSIYDGEDMIASWTSSNKPYRIQGLEKNKEYTLIEDLAPLGYAKASSITFTLTDSKDIQKVQMIDKIVRFSKQDMQGKEVEGAHIMVKDEEDNIIDEWISTDKSHDINNLEEGKTYTLTETLAPDGYVEAESMTFTVTEDKVIQDVIMKDTRVGVRKTDLVNGKEVMGATLSVYEDDKLIDEWETNGYVHYVSNLKTNHHYTLVETQPASGYKVAADITFTPDGKKDMLVKMEDEPILTNIQIIKKDSDTHHIIKNKDFEFTLYGDKACTQVIDKKHADKSTGTILFRNLRYGTYYLKETSAPSGYEQLHKAKEIIIDDNSSGDTITMNIFNKKKSIPTGDTTSYLIYLMLLIVCISSIVYLKRGMS